MVGRRGHADRAKGFRELYDVAYPRIMAHTLRKAQNRKGVLGTVSETFIVVWRRIGDVPGDGRAVPWTYRMARRVLANESRSRDRRASLGCGW